MSTRRQRQIMRNKKIAFERLMEKNMREAETKVVKKKKKKEEE